VSGLDKWLVAQRKLAGAKYVELRHIGVTDEASSVQRWLVDDGGAGTLASEIWTSAQQWADGIGSGPQRFAVAVLDAKDKPLAQYLMRAATDAVGGLAYDSEPATLAGVTKQLMRHTEAIMRGSAAAHAQLIEHLLREHARLSTRCEALEGKHLELLELSEDLLSQRSGRELTRERALMHERRKDELLRKMGMLLPVLMAKLSGTALPAQLDPAVRELAKSLDAEQLDKLTAVLRPEQVIALTTMLERSALPAQPSGARKVLEPEAGHG
jgi:hypothetical protein